MLKHANRGAFPVMVVLGVLIGGSLAMVSVSDPRPSEALSPARPRVVVSPEAPRNDPAGKEQHACDRAMATLADGDLLLSRAIARVLMTCTENPKALELANALLNPPSDDGNPGGESTPTDAIAASGASGVTESGSGASSEAGAGGSDGGGSGGSGGGGSGGGGSGGSDSTGGGGTDGSGSTGGGGSGGSDSSGGGNDNNGKAVGQSDGKGNNG
jgi:hypothetical protein